MQCRLLWPLVVAASVLSACGSEPRDGGPSGAGPDAMTPIRATAIYTEALKSKETDGCVSALESLSLLASWGRGYEVAQYHLGDCYIEMGKTEAEPARGASLASGLKWLTLAANSNNVNAQGKLVEVYLYGLGVAPDSVEAGKWYLLNQRNSIRREIGAKDVAPDLVKALNQSLSDGEWTEAEARADAFVPTVQELKAPYPDPKKMTPGDLRRRGMIRRRPLESRAISTVVEFSGY